MGVARCEMLGAVDFQLLRCSGYMKLLSIYRLDVSRILSTITDLLLGHIINGIEFY